MAGQGVGGQCMCGEERLIDLLCHSVVSDSL